MKHLTAAELKIFLTHLVATLAVFLLFGTIQFGFILTVELAPQFLIVPIFLGILTGVLLGINAVLRMRLRFANQVKSEFISRMSHELRTPMTSIIGFSQYMRHQEDLSEKYQQQAGKIYKAAEYLMGLINDLLDLSKIEAGKIQVNQEVVTVPELIDECIQMLLPLAEEARIRIDTHVQGEDVPQVLADRVRIRQVLMNILSNAVKYNHHGGSVNIGAESYEEYLRISIEDTGSGIPEDFVQHIFDYFTRHPDHADRVGGVGIGMAITRNLVELMGGRIGLNSEFGVGTRVWVEFPRAANVKLAEQHPGRL